MFYFTFYLWKGLVFCFIYACLSPPSPSSFYPLELYWILATLLFLICEKPNFLSHGLQILHVLKSGWKMISELPWKESVSIYPIWLEKEVFSPEILMLLVRCDFVASTVYFGWCGALSFPRNIGPVSYLTQNIFKYISWKQFFLVFKILFGMQFKIIFKY